MSISSKLLVQMQHKGHTLHGEMAWRLSGDDERDFCGISKGEQYRVSLGGTFQRPQERKLTYTILKFSIKIVEFKSKLSTINNITTIMTMAAAYV